MYVRKSKGLRTDSWEHYILLFPTLRKTSILDDFILDFCFLFG
jgi:hypothetical protein